MRIFKLVENEDKRLFVARLGGFENIVDRAVFLNGSKGDDPLVSCAAAEIIELNAVDLLNRNLFSLRLCENRDYSAVFLALCNEDFVNRAIASDSLAYGVSAGDNV